MTTKMPFVLGLTGSIGMGKSTTAEFFRQAGIPAWDADAAVHRLYAKGGAAVAGIAKICPEAILDGVVQRNRLRDWIAQDDQAIGLLNSVVHPLVARNRAQFITSSAASGERLVVVDVPLLFETGGDSRVDATLVVSADPDVQRARVLQRDGMTEAHFQRILASQMQDAEKRKRADFVIETLSLESVQADVARLITTLRQRIANNA